MDLRGPAAATRAAAFAAVGAVVVAGCAAIPPCPAKGGPPWRELTSNHFILRSDLDQDDAIEVLRTLENTRSAMLIGVWPGLPIREELIPAIALSSSRELNAYVPVGFTGIHLRHPPFPPTLVVSNLNLDGGSAAKHELAHHLSHQAIALEPLWYAEGLASYLATTRLDPDDERRSIVGEPAMDRYHFFRSNAPMPIEPLLGGLPTEPFEIARFYATSWLLVHYLLNQRTDQFERFQRRLGNLERGPAAFRAEFPDLASGELFYALEKYARDGRYVVTKWRVSRWNGTHETRLLSDGEVHGVRAFLRAMAGGGAGDDKDERLAAARGEIDEALRAAAPPVEALAVAFYTPHLDYPLSRPALAKLAVKTNPNRWMAWLMAADAAPVGSPEQEQALRRALTLGPTEPEVLIRHARVLADANRWDEVFAISNRILGEGASHPDLWIMHLVALLETGRCEDAARWGAALEGYAPPEAASGLAAIRARPCQSQDKAGSPGP